MKTQSTLLINAIAAGLLVATLPGGTVAETHSPDILDLGVGASVVDHSSQYSTNWKAQWSAVALLDGTTELGWCSQEGATFPHWFVVELPATFELDNISLSNEGAQETRNPGISTRHVEIRMSTAGPETGFHLAGQGEVARGGTTRIAFDKPTEARWIKITILSNWGHSQYTELMELQAQGTQVGAVSEPKVGGVYEQIYEGRRRRTILVQNGRDVTGCYGFLDAGGQMEEPPGRLRGRADGRSLELEWRQAQEHGAGQHGSLHLVVADRGRRFDGLWYGRGEHSSLVGRESTTRVDGASGLVCPADDLAAAIAETGQATLYGIHFEVDSARLSPAAEPTLRQVLELLSGQPGLRLAIEGHTDSVASDAYNLDLSQRRSSSVLEWLVDSGIDSARLEAAGKGESEPVADNATAHGRRLNRRVEIVRLK